MLYIGEKVGTGHGDAVDIAVDPIEGTRMTAMGQANALAVLAVGDKGCFLNAPDMYMEKLIVGPGAKGAIDLNLPLADNLRNIADALGKPLGDLTVTILAKPRHDEVIAEMAKLGVRVFAIPDGDVAASILTCMPDSEVDVLYGIGGAPEGVVSAAVIRALDGDMQGRLLARHDVKGDSEENRRIGEQELARCKAMGIEAGKALCWATWRVAITLFSLRPASRKAICWKELAERPYRHDGNAADPRQITHHPPHSVYPLS